MRDDPRLSEAKAMPIRDVVDRLGIAALRPTGAELVGPCPLCGGRDRFAINLRSQAFLCRRCDIRGGDGVALVQAVMGLPFRDALSWLCGDLEAQIDPAEMERRKARARAAEEKRAAEAARYRDHAIADARSIWSRAVSAAGTLAETYLRRRGIAFEAFEPWPQALRFLPDHPYVRKIDGQLVTVHRGPCMIAGVLSPPGDIAAVHQTWISANPPHCKATVRHADQDLPAKMVRGSKKGGAIRLVGPDRAETLVMGEGIETTLSAWIGRPIEGAAYWAGVDLGNMGGRAARVAGRRWHGLPDMTDAEAFVAPPWVTRLVYLMDGDSDPRATRHRLECGLRRAKAHRPELRAQIVEAARGRDFNDMLTEAPT